jgi:hypothetical protein
MNRPRLKPLLGVYFRPLDRVQGVYATLLQFHMTTGVSGVTRLGVDLKDIVLGTSPPSPAFPKLILYKEAVEI